MVSVGGGGGGVLGHWSLMGHVMHHNMYILHLPGVNQAYLVNTGSHLAHIHGVSALCLEENSMTMG